MLYDRIQTKDLEQYFNHSLFMYANRPVWCEKVEGATSLVVRDLETQESFEIIFDPTLCKGIESRIGMVNTNAGVVWVCRLPSRRYSIGINGSNTSIVDIGDGAGSISLRNFNSAFFVKALKNEYPSFEEAIASGKDCAFDKQFAVTKNWEIWYRQSIVGTLVDKKIAWFDGWHHLGSLLEESYADNRESLRI